MTHSQMRLADRTAVVTGAGAGIGKGVALALAAEGAKVVLAARRKHTIDETASLIAQERGRALAIECDVSVRSEVDSLVTAAVEKFGGVDIVIHCAISRESAQPLDLAAITADQWIAQAGVAWDATLFLAQAAHPFLQRSGHGRFVLFGSCMGRHGSAMNPVYSALKGGLRGFVKALAREWAPDQITVNAVEPAALTEPTEMFLSQHPEKRHEFLSLLPMGRMGDPREDIGRAVAAICTAEFSFMTAQSIQLDGGCYTAT